MNNLIEARSSAASTVERRKTTFVHGVGEVPSGPRTSFSPFRVPPRRAQTANTSFNAFVHIKREESQPNWSSDSAVEEGEVPQDDNIKREASPEPAELPEFDPDYQNTFSRLLASSERSSRSDTTGSRRQDTSEGRWGRSERLTSSRYPNRSPSPRSSDSLNYTSSRSSSMFYPDSRASTDPYPDTYIPPYSRLRRAPLDATTDNLQGRSPPRLSLPSQDSSSSPSPTMSLLPAEQTSLISSSTEPSPPPEENEEVDTRCRCPIGIMCRVRSANHLDCRPLVGEPKTWRERRDEEAFEQHREAGSQGERFTTDQDLARVINYTSNFFLATTPAARRTAVLDMRTWIIDMEDVTLTAGVQQTIAIQQVIPALTAFLSPGNAPARRAGNLPGYIEEELTVLERKWGRGDFSGAVKRGLTAVTVFDQNGIPYRAKYQVDPTWPFYVSAKYFGAGNLVNGQVWESRAELQRDGVHAPPIAGISGTAKGGARSVVLGAFDEKNNLGYADIDMGDVIEYMGTALPDQDGLGPTNVKDLHMGMPNAWDPNSQVEPTKATQAMRKSLETGEPVRVIRSFAMCKIVRNKPVKGYRYDGLYRVIRETAMKEARQIWSFRMQRLPERLPDHGPLRGFRNKADQPSSSGRRMGHFHR